MGDRALDHTGFRTEGRCPRMECLNLVCAVGCDETFGSPSLKDECQTGSLHGNDAVHIQPRVKQGDVISSIFCHARLKYGMRKWKARLSHHRVQLAHGDWLADMQHLAVHSTCLTSFAQKNLKQCAQQSTAFNIHLLKFACMYCSGKQRSG